jgi:hypothetical protein
MYKMFLFFVFLFVATAATADPIYFDQPTSENALNHLRSKGSGNVSEIIVLVDPATGDANRYYIESYQDWDSANADLVVKVEALGMSADMQTFAKAQVDNYGLVDTIAKDMDGVDFDTFRLLEGNTGILDKLIEEKFAPVRENIRKQVQLLTPHEKNTLSIQFQQIEFRTKDGFTFKLDFKMTQSTEIVNLISVTNRAGTPFYPRPDWDTTKIELLNPTHAEFESLINYFKLADYVVNFPSGTSIPSGSVSIVDCHSATKTCDVSINPQKNKQ